MDQLEVIFGELGISQYLEAFVEQGFDSWETILDVTESDLDALGVKLGHRRKLQRRIANSRGIAPDAALGCPTSTLVKPDEPRLETPRPEAVKPPEQKDGVTAKRKYRRHPKPDENAPERPPSAYVLFSNKMREDLKGRNLTFTEIAKLVGENWQSLTPAEKEPYGRQAQQAKEKYNRDLAEYKKTAKYHQYNQYLHEFKLKHSSNHPQDKDSQKRPRLEANRPNPGSPNSSTSLGGGNSRGGNAGGTASGESLQGKDAAAMAPHRPSPTQQDTGSVSTTPLSFHTNTDEPLTSPGTQGHGFYEQIEHSPTPFQQEPHPGHRSRRSSSWRLTEPNHHPHLPSLSDVFDHRQPSTSFAQNSPEGTGYMGFMQTHHRSGPGPPDHPTSTSEPRPLPAPFLRKEHSSAGSMSSAPRSGSSTSSTQATTASSKSGSQSLPPSHPTYPRTPSEPSLPLPIHALLTSKPGFQFESPQGPTLQSGDQRSSQIDHPAFPHCQPQSRTPGTMSPNSLDYPNTSNDYQSPQSSVYPPPSRGGIKPDGNGTDEQPQEGNRNAKGDQGGMDGMSALLRAGEIVDRRTR